MNSTFSFFLLQGLFCSKEKVFQSMVRIVSFFKKSYFNSLFPRTSFTWIVVSLLLFLTKIFIETPVFISNTFLSLLPNSSNSFFVASPCKSNMYIVSVSYTHLDVYKRQLKIYVSGVRFPPTPQLSNIMPCKPKVYRAFLFYWDTYWDTKANFALFFERVAFEQIS